MNSGPTSSPPIPGKRAHARLWAEWLVLFVGVPLAMTVALGQFSLFAVLWALAAVSVVLLTLTPGFSWRMLWRMPDRGSLLFLLGWTALTGVVSFAVVETLRPGAFLSMPLYRPGLWLLIMVFYPILSAWPQELIYRTLFFERYGALFPSAPVAIAVNGFAFGLGHLFFMNPVTITMTALGGAVMGWAYLARGRSVLLAWAMHSVAGQIIFTFGLGVYFYHGAIAR